MHLRRVVALGAVILLTLGTGIADAANGGSLLLGRRNHQTTGTKLVNDTAGTTLLLRPTSPDVPPLRVNSSTKVSRLNADRLDGVSAETFQTPTNSACVTSAGGLQSVAADGKVSCQVFTRAFARTVVVPAGADPLVSGAALLDAVAAITTATADDPWLVQLLPGTYNLGTATLTLKPHVEIAGAGRDMTMIIGDDRTVTAAAGSGLRDLTVLAEVGPTYNNVRAYVADATGTSYLTDVWLVSIADYVDGNAPNNNYALEVNAGAVVEARGVELLASGGTASVYAFVVNGSNLHLVQARITAPGRAVNGAVVRIADSEVQLAITSISATVSCVASWSLSFTALSASCT